MVQGIYAYARTHGKEFTIIVLNFINNKTLVRLELPASMKFTTFKDELKGKFLPLKMKSANVLEFSLVAKEAIVLSPVI